MPFKDGAIQYFTWRHFIDCSSLVKSDCSGYGVGAYLITLSKASRILLQGSSADREATLERSSQAPVACSASVCEIRLAMNLDVSEFFLDQTLMALLK